MECRSKIQINSNDLMTKILNSAGKTIVLDKGRSNEQRDTMNKLNITADFEPALRQAEKTPMSSNGIYTEKIYIIERLTTNTEV